MQMVTFFVNDMIFVRFQIAEISVGKVKDFVVFIVRIDPFVKNFLFDALRFW